MKTPSVIEVLAQHRDKYFPLLDGSDDIVETRNTAITKTDLETAVKRYQELSEGAD